MNLLSWPPASSASGGDPTLGPLPVNRAFLYRCLRMLLVVTLLSLIAYVLSMDTTSRLQPYPTYLDDYYEYEEHERPDLKVAATYAPGHGTDLHIHDPSVIKVGSLYYAYGPGNHMVIHEAPSLDGPWTRLGSLLDQDSVIPKGDRRNPWAPHVIEADGTFYCYYTVSRTGCRDSAIGVATSKTPGPGDWKDHGMLIQSGTGRGSEKFPFDRSNTIDASVIVTGDGKGYLTWGSYWTGIWQLPLNSELVSVDETGRFEARHLASEPKVVFPPSKNPNPLCGDSSGGHPIEGSFVHYHAPYYYLWVSWGKCCNFNPKKPMKVENVYNIRVGRSDTPQGPFVDKSGHDLLAGGGEIVYASNRDIYAPGGQGILTDEGTDILYYHYLNTTISLEYREARLGYNPLSYVDGWPVAQ